MYSGETAETLRTATDQRSRETSFMKHSLHNSEISLYKCPPACSHTRMQTMTSLQDTQWASVSRRKSSSQQCPDVWCLIIQWKWTKWKQDNQELLTHIFSPSAAGSLVRDACPPGIVCVNGCSCVYVPVFSMHGRLVPCGVGRCVYVQRGEVFSSSGRGEAVGCVRHSGADHQACHVGHCHGVSWRETQRDQTPQNRAHTIYKEGPACNAVLTNVVVQRILKGQCCRLQQIPNNRNPTSNRPGNQETILLVND